MGSISHFNQPSLSGDCGNWRISHSCGPVPMWSSLALPAQGKPISVWRWRTGRSSQAIPCCLPPWLNWRKRWRVLRILVSCASASDAILLPTRLFIDEVGYTKLSQEQAHHFFELVTARYEHGSIILTSNTSFAQWGALLGDEVLATALLDRLLHHAEVIPINGRSYRMKERQTERTGLSASPEVALGATGGKSTGVG